MQVRLTLAAALLALTATVGMAQEIDSTETLQARSLAAQARSTSDEAAAQARIAAATPTTKAAKSHKRSDWSHVYDRHPHQASAQLAFGG